MENYKSNGNIVLARHGDGWAMLWSGTDEEAVNVARYLNAAYAAGQASSPPTLNIGMGEPVAWADKEQLDNLRNMGDMMVASERDDTFQIPYDIPLYANAHTKAVTVDAIVKLAEEWDAYCVVTPTDPDGIKDFRARLLKLIQE